MAIKQKSLKGIKTTSVSLPYDLSIKMKEDILSGKIKNGEKLVEQKICKDYQVSRTPVREALSRLEAEGLVTNIPNRGSFVRGISDDEMIDIFTLRKIYEIQAMRWAIERITDEELEELEENFEFMVFYTKRNDVEKMLNINALFHRLIYKASHNYMLCKMLSSYQIYVKYHKKNSGNNPDYLNNVLTEHRAIYNSFLQKDIEVGANAMEIHMNNSMKRHGIII